MEFHKENIRDHRIYSNTDMYCGAYALCIYLMGGPWYVIVLQIVELFIQALPVQPTYASH